MGAQSPEIGEQKVASMSEDNSVGANDGEHTGSGDHDDGCGGGGRDTSEQNLPTDAQNRGIGVDEDALSVRQENEAGKPKLYKRGDDGSWEALIEYDDDELDPDSLLSLCCKACVYVYIGENIAEDIDDATCRESVLSDLRTARLPAGNGLLKMLQKSEACDIIITVNESKHGGTPLWDAFLDAFEEGF